MIKTLHCGIKEALLNAMRCPDITLEHLVCLKESLKVIGAEESAEQLLSVLRKQSQKEAR